MTNILERSNISASDYPLIDDAQAGHIRHIRRLLLEQPDGDWSKMGVMEAGQEGLSALRYQISHMFYALGLAHYHRLPAAPAVFKDVMISGMRKMLRREVWGYWRESSRSGPKVDPGITQLREPWGDPVIKENIMYSGQLHAMAGMFGVLFNDDRFERPGGLTMQHSPLFVGDEERYEYDFCSLTDIIYWQMVENGWLGVACEPNCIFLFCNQFPMLGFRFHDIRKGTCIAEEATESYVRAWQDRGVLTPDAEMPMMLFQRQNILVPGGPANDAAVGALMNAWRRDFVHSYYGDRVRFALKPGPYGTISLLPVGLLPTNADDYAHDEQQPVDETSVEWTTPDFGSMTMLMSEMGDESLQGLLAHADRFMSPVWDHGALYYPRHDQSYDDEGNLTFVEPLTGNATIAYSRLNVPDGLWQLYNKPWTPSHFRQPHLVDFPAEHLDVLRAIYDDDHCALVLTFRPVQNAVDATIVIANPEGRSAELYRDGQRLEQDVAIEDSDRRFLRLRIKVDQQIDVVATFGGGN